MLELLKSAFDALRAGEISPATFVVLLFLGLLAWAARKGGEKALASISGLLAEGEKLRKTLNSQLDATVSRATALELQRDEALRALADERVRAAEFGERLRSYEIRIRDLDDEIQMLNEEVARLRLRATIAASNAAG